MEIQKRFTINEYYLNIANAVSSRSSCLKKHYGAVIVKDDRIVSTGYNNAPAPEEHCKVCTKKDGHKDFDEYCSCPAVHAEMNAIISASKEEMQGAVLYLAGYDVETDSEIAAKPCEICLRLIKNSGINKVYNKEGTLYTRDDWGVMQVCSHD